MLNILRPSDRAAAYGVALAGAHVVYEVHAALAWAEPLVGAEFARAGKPCVVLHVKDGAHSPGSRHHAEEGDDRPAQAIDLALRPPEGGAPWFSAGVARDLAENISRVLNALAPRGPGGCFEARLGRGHLHLEWNAQAPSPERRVARALKIQHPDNSRRIS